MNEEKITLQSTWILKIFLLSLALILSRVFILQLIQYDKHYEKASKPQRRTLVEEPSRAIIQDRFHIPLAVNKLQYNASVVYADIRQIPSVAWEKRKGKSFKILQRRQYVEKLCQFLGKELGLEPQDIEDILYGKASLFPHTPFVLKEELSEEQYYKLKMAEKDWAGLHMIRGSKRVYPQGSSACDVIGYMGPIDQKQLHALHEKIEMLKNYLAAKEEGKPVILPKGYDNPEAVKTHLEELLQHGYTLNSQVGKSGVEAQFDAILRGTQGKKMVRVDTQGNIFEEFPGKKEAKTGESLTLSLSSELQLEAEKLLSAYELLQDKKDLTKSKERVHPWLRGSAAVVMDAKTGEVLTLASYPRFDPNDFIPSQNPVLKQKKQRAISRWLESERSIGDIWEGKEPLRRELFSPERGFFTEECFLDLNGYLDALLPKKGFVRTSFDSIDSLHSALDIHASVKQLLLLSKQASMEELIDFLYYSSSSLSEEEQLLKAKIDPYLSLIPEKEDKLLLLDLLRLIASEERFSSSLIPHIEHFSLGFLFRLSQAKSISKELLKPLLQECFYKNDFQKWRKEHFKTFLQAKRLQEKKQHTYTRPYTEYLERQKQVLFKVFFKKHAFHFLEGFLLGSEIDSSPYMQLVREFGTTADHPLIKELKEALSSLPKEVHQDFLTSLRSFEDLNRPLYGHYPTLHKTSEGLQLEKHLASAFYPYTGFGYGRSQAFRQASPMGSIFKLIPAYASITHQYLNHQPLSALTLLDDMKWTAKPGSNDQILGYLENGQPIKRLYKGGRLPRAYHLNIGTIGMVEAIERSSNVYFSIIAAEFLNSPEDLLIAARNFGLGRKSGIDLPGEYAGSLPDDIHDNKTGLYSFAIGQHSLVATPLQTAVTLSTIANGKHVPKPQILLADTLETQGEIFFPPEVRSFLLKGMYQVVNGARGSARPSGMATQFHLPESVRSYRNVYPYMVGKTGTAEILYKHTIDKGTLAHLEKHVWFGAISFTDTDMQDPEIVVAVYLRFGEGGRHAAPIAARLIEKWREIKAKHAIHR